MKRAPGRALNVSPILKCTVFQGEAVRDDGKSPNPLFWVKTAVFRSDIFPQIMLAFEGFLLGF